MGAFSTCIVNALLCNVFHFSLGSYGSLARFRDVSRLKVVGDSNTVVGGSGDYADFQHIQSLLEQKV